MAGPEEPGARRQGECGSSEVDLFPGRTEEAAQDGLGGVDEIQGELVADPLGLEGVLEPRVEPTALFPETGDEDLVSLFHRSTDERLAARFPGGQGRTRRRETRPDAEGGGEEVVGGLPGELLEVAPSPSGEPAPSVAVFTARGRSRRTDGVSGSARRR